MPPIRVATTTLLGRVMGCVEQVFIHDGLGHPVYFENYSGHGPTGEHILSLFEKIEEVIEDVPRSKARVFRAIVMDGANNSVKTLRAFAAQDTFHYITTLDDNQWNDRRVRSRSYPMRYRYGKATLRDLEIELKDSQEKGYLIFTRAIIIEWDHGRKTVLLTNLPKSTVDASEKELSMAGLTLEQLEERTVLAFMEQATAEEFAKVVEKIPNKTEALQKILNLLEDDELAKLLEERKKMKY